MDYTPEQMVEAASKKGFLSALTKIGTIPTVRLAMPTDFLEEPIDSIDLSLRAYNALRRNGITTIRDLIEAIRSQNLKNMKNLGKKSAGEIKLSLTMSIYNSLSKDEKIQFWKYYLEKSDEHSRYENADS